MDSFVVVEKKIIEEALASSPTQGKKSLEPLKSFAAANRLPFNILEDSGVIDTKGEIHEREGDLWQCLEGEVTFVCGGELTNPEQIVGKPGEWKGSGVDGGTEIILRPRDWLWIPPGEPHSHRCADTGRMVIIKIPKKQ